MEGAAPVEWLPSVAFLVVGLVLGAALVWWARKGKPAPAPAAPLDVRDLAGLRDALVRQLRELEDTAAKRNPEQLAQERYGLELELARALQTLDARRADGCGQSGEDGGGHPVPGAPAAPSALRGFFWGTGSMAVLVLLLYFVSRSARPREGSAPVTGNTPMAQPATPDGRPRSVKRRGRGQEQPQRPRSASSA